MVGAEGAGSAVEPSQRVPRAVSRRGQGLDGGLAVFPSRGLAVDLQTTTEFGYAANHALRAG